MKQTGSGARLAVIVPSRGRPSAVAEMVRTFRATCTADTQLIVAVDEDDDPDAYVRAAFGLSGGEDDGGGAPLEATEMAELGLLVLRRDRSDPVVVVADSHSLVEALNLSALFAVWCLEPFALGFVGDDALPRTHGWDADVLSSLDVLGVGMVYPNDLLQGEALPTTVFLTADIVKELGYFAPPQFHHLFIDNVWLAWGKLSGRLSYLRDTVIEHMHPLAGKAAWDAGHVRVNSRSAYERGHGEYAAYCAGPLADDVAKINALAARTVIAVGT